MCCRYYFDPYVLRYTEKKTGVYYNRRNTVSSKEIKPRDLAPVLAGARDTLIFADMRFGFLLPDHSCVFNARQESVLQKKLFSESTLRRRCVIPAGEFYEWDRERTRVTVKSKEDIPLFFAGIYSISDNMPCFSILTTKANASMCTIHDRMPLLLREEQIREWIFEPQSVKSILSRTPEELSIDREYEQLSLF